MNSLSRTQEAVNTGLTEKHLEIVYKDNSGGVVVMGHLEKEIENG